MRKGFLFLSLMVLGGTVYAKNSLSPEKTVMNIVELTIPLNREHDFDEVAKQTISASVAHEADTLAMYALRRNDAERQAFMVEIYENEKAYRQHLKADPYRSFTRRADDIIKKKEIINLKPQFLGDKHILQNERTINNLVIVDVKPEFWESFKSIVVPEMKTSLKVEEGVLGMYAATDIKNKNRWYFYEVYASNEDYLNHRETSHFKDYLANTSNMTVAKKAIPVSPLFLKNKGSFQNRD